MRLGTRIGISQHRELYPDTTCVIFFCSFSTFHDHSVNTGTGVDLLVDLAPHHHQPFPNNTIYQPVISNSWSATRWLATSDHRHIIALMINIECTSEVAPCCCHWSYLRISPSRSDIITVCCCVKPLKKLKHWIHPACFGLMQPKRILCILLFWEQFLLLGATIISRFVFGWTDCFLSVLSSSCCWFIWSRFGFLHSLMMWFPLLTKFASSRLL